MGCASNRKKQTLEFQDQKWDYINLKDFKANGCGAPFAYGYLWFSLILSIVVYAVDSFTAYQLLVFDRWSSTIQPGISLHVSKWIFSVCIILSFVNLLYEGVRAIRVMKRENVAECFMDNLAVKWESIRMGKGQGWKRFLVFAALTESKKGAEYIALFTYFGFKSWIRVILCSGPRQVVNLFTLKAVYEANLLVQGKDVGDSITSFFDKIKTLADQDYRQAVILCGMAFTFVIWAFSAIVLLLSVLFYVFFLFHWIPRADGGLSGYCERKVNKKLLKIVTKTYNKALAKQQERDAKTARKNGEKGPMDRTATLPVLSDDDGLPSMPATGLNDSTPTLPMYETRPSTPSNIEMKSIDSRRPVPSRTGTMASQYSARQPLVGAAADMGYGRPASPAPSLPEPNLPYGRNASPSPLSREPTLPRMDARQPTLPQMDEREPTLPQMDGPGRGKPLPEPTLPNMELPPLPPPVRPGTASSQRSQGPRQPPAYPPNNNSQYAAAQSSFTESPTAMEPIEMPAVPFDRSASTKPEDNPGSALEQGVSQKIQGSYGQRSQDSYPRPSPTPGPAQAQYTPYRPYGSQDRASPAPSTNPYHPDNAPSRQQTPMGQPPISRRPVQPPVRRGTDQPSSHGTQQPMYRNLTGPIQPPRSAPPMANYNQRSQTPQSARPPPNEYSYGGSTRGGSRSQREEDEWQQEYGYRHDVEAQRDYGY